MNAIQLRIALARLFGGGPRRHSRITLRRFSRRGDADASEKVRVLAAKKPHDAAMRMDLRGSRSSVKSVHLSYGIATTGCSTVRNDAVDFCEIVRR